MTTVTIVRRVPVGPGVAWRAWVDPVELAKWWWPMLGDTTYEWGPRAGASYAIHSRDAGFGVRGVFTEVDEPRRLVFSWSWVSEDDPQPPLDTVEVTFEAEGTGTLITVRHSSPVDRPEMDGLVQGWEGCLGRCVEALARREG